MHDFGNVLTVVVLQVATAVLVMGWIRSRTPISFSWALGWLLVLCRLALIMVSPWGGKATLIASDCFLQLAALVFLDSVDRAYVSVKLGIPAALACALPVTLYSATIHLAPDPSTSSIPVSLSMLGIAAVISSVWAIRNAHINKWVSLTGIAVVTALGSQAIFTHHPERAAGYFLAGAFAMTGASFSRRYPRGSTGSSLAVMGFFGNSFVTLLSLALAQIAIGNEKIARILDHTSDFIWVITAVGMMIVLMEEDARTVRHLQQKERRLREELQHYANVQLSTHLDSSDEKVYLSACVAIAERSPFREVALLKRNARGEAEVICHSNLHTANSRGIAGLTQRYSAGDENLKLSFQGSRSVIVRTAETERKRDHKVPARSLVVSLPGQSGKQQGWLWLAGPAAGWNAIHTDDLLPLESLASRLAVTMENQELTRMLIRTDKLAGLGKLAGGVAHELNNPLTVVCGYAEIIHESTLEPSTRKQTAKILSEAMRMKRIIEDLNSFSQPPTAEYGAQDMVEVLQEVGQSLQGELMRRGVSYELHNRADTSLVYGCRDSLQQIFFQLVVNSAEALERANRDGKTITAPKVRLEVDHKDGKVNVLVTDNGPGFLEPERVFDPFYTTKDPGEGPGLGLSVSYALVHEHQGDIYAYNLKPRGAAVSVSLPCAPSELLRMPAAPHKTIAGLPVASVPKPMPLTA